MLCDWELEFSGGGRPKRDLVLAISIPVAEDGSMPRGIDTLLSALHTDPLLQRDFPQIDLGGIRRAESMTGQSTAELTVVCLPGAGGKGK